MGFRFHHALIFPATWFRQAQLTTNSSNAFWTTRTPRSRRLARRSCMARQKRIIYSLRTNDSFMVKHSLVRLRKTPAFSESASGPHPMGAVPAKIPLIPSPSRTTILLPRDCSWLEKVRRDARSRALFILVWMVQLTEHTICLCIRFTSGFTDQNGTVSG